LQNIYLEKNVYGMVIQKHSSKKRLLPANHLLNIV